MYFTASRSHRSSVLPRTFHAVALRLVVFAALLAAPIGLAPSMASADGPTPVEVTFKESGSYAGTSDTYVNQSAPTADYGTKAYVQWLGGPGLTQVGLIRFIRLFVSEGGPIPDSVRIESASLQYFVTSPGSEATVYEATSTWGESVTWDSFGATAGVGTEDYYPEPVATASAGAGGYQTVDVTTSLQGWSDGVRPNLGWLFLPGESATLGATFVSSEGNADRRPILTVTYSTAPAAISQSATTAEDTAKAITIRAVDPLGQPLTYQVLTQPQHGTLTGTAPSLQYTPAADYYGPDSFTFRAGAGGQESNVATVSITVTAVNDTPTASAQAVMVNEDTELAITLAGSDPDGDSLTYTVVPPPQHGDLSGAGADRIYTPAAEFHGDDSFTFAVRDGVATSAEALVSITVLSVPDAPVVDNPGDQANAEGVTVALQIAARDADEGDTLSYAATNLPEGLSIGAESGLIAGDIGYRAAGTHAVTVAVTDSSVPAHTTSVSFAWVVADTNRPPVAGADAVDVAEDGQVQVRVLDNDADPDEDVLSVTAATQGDHGAVTVAADGQSVTYAPTEDYNGDDEFTYTVSDGKGATAAASVSVHVTAVNDAPVAEPQSLVTDADMALPITLNGSDVDGDALTYAVVAAPSHGALVGDAPSLTYTPAAGYDGPDAFAFSASDGHGGSSTATVTITVQPRPRITSLALRQSPDQTLWSPVAGSLGDGFALALDPRVDFYYLDVDSAATNKRLVAGYYPFYLAMPQTQSFYDYWAAEPRGVDVDAADWQAVMWQIINGNQPMLYLRVTDDGGGQVLALVDGLLHLLGQPDARLRLYGTYPQGDYRFQGAIADSLGGTTPLTVTVRLNHVPLVADGTLTTAEDVPTDVTLVADDYDGDALTYEIVGGPQHGVLTGSGPTMTYAPGADYFGVDSFTYRVGDGQAVSDQATVSISVTPVNDPPLAQPQAVIVAEDGEVTITLSATDADGDPLTYAVATPPSHGQLTEVANGLLRYRPAANYHGGDAFTYAASDGAEASAPATVAITVQSLNDAPVLQPIANQAGAEGEAVALQVAAADVDDEDTLVFGASGLPAGLSIDPATGAIAGTLGYDAAGEHAVVVTVADDGTPPEEASVAFRWSVAPTNRGPVATGQTVTVLQGASVTIVLAGSDIDGDALTYSIEQAPAHGTLSGAAPSLVYTPDDGFAGPDAFTYTVSDGALSSPEATVDFVVESSEPTVKSYRLYVPLMWR